MNTVELALFADEAGRVDYQCPHCGAHQDILPALRREMSRFDLIMHQARSLPRGAKRFLETALPILVEGDAVGVRELSRETAYSTSTTQRHLRALAAAGLIVPVPKRAGGRYCVYKLKESRRGK